MTTLDQSPLTKLEFHDTDSIHDWADARCWLHRKSFTVSNSANPATPEWRQYSKF